jgi:hypothetical protein
MLKEITQPCLFGTVKQKKKKRTSVRQALIAASNLIQMDSTYQAKTDDSNSKTVYLSQNDDELHIVIDTGACVSHPDVTIFKDHPANNQELKGLNSSQRR